MRLVDQGRLDVPAGADLAEFLLYDGKLVFAPNNGVDLPLLANTADSNGSLALRPLAAGQLSTSKSLGAILDEYYPKPDEDTFVPETLRVARVHASHLKKILGAKTPIATLDSECLQDYVNRRQQSAGRRGNPTLETSFVIGDYRAAFAEYWESKFNSAVPITALRSALDPPIPVRTVIEFNKFALTKDATDVESYLETMAHHLADRLRACGRSSQRTLFPTSNGHVPTKLPRPAGGSTL